MRRRRETGRVVAACLAALGGVFALPAHHAAGASELTGTFQELHVDKIPAGRHVDVLVSNG